MSTIAVKELKVGDVCWRHSHAGVHQVKVVKITTVAVTVETVKSNEKFAYTLYNRRWGTVNKRWDTTIDELVDQDEAQRLVNMYQRRNRKHRIIKDCGDLETLAKDLSKLTRDGRTKWMKVDVENLINGLNVAAAALTAGLQEWEE